MSPLFPTSMVSRLFRRKPKSGPKRSQPRLELLEDLIVPAPIPTVSFLNPDTKPFIGETNQFTLQFTNASPTDVGFTPYIDLFLPATGIDGADAATDDGITFVSATYLGSALKTTTVTLVAGNQGVAHPFAKNPDGTPRRITLAQHPGFKAGDKLVVIEPPLGSFTASQPPLNIVVTTQVSNLADLNQPLPIEAQAGFRFGSDPLDNPQTDPPILGTGVVQNFTPTLYKFFKESLAPENETATGPNFVRQFRLRLDVANGQTLDQVKFQDLLPGEFQYVSIASLAGGTENVGGRITPSTVTSGGNLQRVLNSVTGTLGSNDAELVFNYFVPIRNDANAVIIEATGGDDVPLPNDATLTASWAPIDPRDPVEAISQTVPTTPSPIVAKSIATQKSVSAPPGGALPGAILTYTIQFQISDYFAFQNLVLTDLLGDGQNMVPGSLNLFVADAHGNGGTTNGPVLPANFTLTPNKPGTNFKDEILVRISDELVSRGFSNGRLAGGMIPLNGTGGAVMPNQPPVFGGTVGTITFQAQIQDSYQGTVPSGEKPINPNDKLENSVTIAGDLLSVNDISTPTGLSEEDTSAASVVVPPTQFTKSIYAKNGVVGNYPGTTLISPGDTITYRLQYTVPLSDAEQLVIDDYLPLPIFDVDDAGTGIASQDLVTTGTNNPPAPGKWSLRSTDTFSAVHGGLLPGVTIQSLSNRVRFDYGTIDDPTNQPSSVDILFTVTANNLPYADLLRLANRAYVSANNSDLDIEDHEAIAEVTSSEPELSIRKGIVATDNPAGVFSPATVGPVPFSAPGSAGTRFTGTINSAGLASKPINSNLSEVDADDLVTYAIVVENKGSGRFGAFDVVIKDSPSAGLEIPGFGVGGINLRVTDGAGNPLPFANIGAGLFEGGIELLDPSATQGSLRRGKDDNGTVTADGSNIVIITYDMKMLEQRVLRPLVNTGAVTSYAGTEGGPDFTGSGSLEDPATVTVGTNNLLAKELVSTEIVNSVNANNEAVIGELATYKVTIRMPEAFMENAVLTDTLDGRMAFVDMVGVTMSPALTITGSTAPVVSNNGQKLTFNLGKVTNSDRDNKTAETITFTYTTVILNKSTAQGGNQVQNLASLSFTGLGNPKTAKAPVITIIEPHVQITKDGKFDTGDPAVGDADDPITYTILLKNPIASQANTADAFDVTLSDPLPKLAGGSLVVNPSFTVTDNLGLVDASLFEIIGTAATGFTLQTKPGVSFDMPANNTRTITIEIKGNLPSAGSGLVIPGTLFTNTARTEWTSLDGDPGVRSTHNPDSVERNGSGGINDYRGTDSVDLQVTGLGFTKSIVATSESATPVEDQVVIGEIVRFRLVSLVPEGSVSNNSFALTDQIPAGMKFLDDGTAKVALVSAGNLTASSIPAGSAYVTGASATGVVPSFVLPAGTVLGAPFNDGSDVIFDLGKVTNADSDLDDEFIIVEYNVLVTNVIGNNLVNNQGNELVNMARIVVDGTATNQTGSEVVRIAEPSLNHLQKIAVGPDGVTPLIGPFDAGDQIRFRIEGGAQAGSQFATAYDVRFHDPLPAGKMTLVPGSVKVFRNGTEIFTGFTDNSSATAMDLTLAKVEPGDQIVILYETVLTSAVEAGTTFPNTVELTATSVPGPNGTPNNPTGSQIPGIPGSPTGERNGSDGPGGLNDYQATTHSNITIQKPSLFKSIFETSPVETTNNQFNPNLADFTVGELVTYRLIVEVPEGTTPNLVMVDQLPTANGRMKYLSSRVVSIGSQISGSKLAVGSSGAESGGEITFDLGTLVNAPDGLVNEHDRIVIEIDTQVMNVADNKAGADITNIGSMTYTVNGSKVSEQVGLVSQIVEPELSIDKSILKGGATTDLLQADAGEIITFRVAVQHTAASSGPAFSIKIADTLPNGLELIPASIKLIQDPIYPSSFYDPTIVQTNVGGNPNSFFVFFDYIDNPNNDLALGSGNDRAVIEYQAKVTTAVAPGSSIINTAGLTYDSLYTERSSALFPESTRAYSSSDPSTIVVNTNSVAGSVYHDLNRDQLLTPGEPLLAGVTIQLVGTDHLGQPVSLSTTTDGNGAYLFANLRPGTYTVIETQPNGFVSNGEQPGTPFANGSPGENQLALLIPTGTNTPNDGKSFNFAEVLPAAVKGFVYYDKNNDGLFDPTESPIPGVALTLTGTNLYGAITSINTLTGPDGSYSFEGLLPGTYTVTETQPNGYLDGKNTIGSTGGSSAISNQLSSIIVNPGETSQQNNFGELLPSSLSGKVYVDINGDDIRNPGEPPIAHVRVELTGIDDRGTPVNLTTFTDLDGKYSFGSLRPGTYEVKEIQPDGYSQGSTLIGSVGGLVTTQDVMGQITLQPGTDGIHYDFNETGIKFEKTIAATSETATLDPTKVVIGEIVRYRIVAMIPEGNASSTSYAFIDQIPAGLRFLNDGTAKVAFVANGGFTSTIVSDPLAFVTGGTDLGVTPVSTLPNASILGGPFGDGTDVTFDLGGVVNNDNDANLEFVVIEYNALVLNVSANQEGVTRANGALIHRDGNPSGQTSSTSVSIAEPNLVSFAKMAVQNDDLTAAPGPFDAGDIIRYRVGATAETGTNRSTAYDVRFLDQLPSTRMTLVPGSVRVLRNGAQILTGFSNASTASVVDVTLDVVEPGDEIVVLYDTALTNAVEAETTVPNTVVITATSVPGPSGTPGNPTGSIPPGLPGGPDGERNGTDGPGPGLNNYSGETGTTVLIAGPSFEKTLFESSPVETAGNQFDPNRADFTVGELVTYQIKVTLQEGTTPSVLVRDLLPVAGGRMKYLSSKVAFIGSNIVGSSLPVGASGTEVGGTVSFDLGTLINQADGLSNSNDTIVLEVQAQVMNVGQNVAGSTLVNDARFEYQVGANTIEKTSQVTSEIVEPDLAISKGILKGGNTIEQVLADAGEIITFRVKVNHTATSTGPAFSVKIADTLPVGLELIPSSLKVINHPTYPSLFFDAPVIQTGVGGNPNAFTVVFDYLDNPSNPLALGGDEDSATIEYQARVTTAVTPGSPIVNTANLTYDSLYGEIPSTTSPETTRAYSNSDPSTIVVNTNSVAGSVYHDLNRDQLLTPGEPLLAGVTIQLVGTDHLGQPVSLSTTTDGNGAYLFANLRPGNYTVIETQPNGFVSNGEQPGTPFANGSPGENQLALLIPTGTNTPNDGKSFNFAEVLPAAVKGFVYYDKNNDGLFDPTESPIPGVALTLTGTNLYGAITSINTLTGPDGSYSFEGLLPGTYTVTETQPNGYLDGKNTIGSTGGSSAISNQLSSIVVNPGETSQQNNFGELLPSSLSGKVYVDINKNNQLDAAEKPLRNVVIELTGVDDRGDPVSVQTTTDQDGRYNFPGLRPGEYAIRETQPPGFIQGRSLVGSEGGSNSTLDLLSTIILNPGTDGINYDFTEFAKPADPLNPTNPLVPGKPLTPQIPVSKQSYLTTSPNMAWILTAPTQPTFTRFNANGNVGSAAFLVTGSGPGSGLVRVFDYGQNVERFRFRPYGNSPVAVRVAKGDVTGDGVPDFITAPGAGMAPLIRVYDGNNGKLVTSFFAYSQAYNRGVFVAAGDTDGDGKAEILTGTDVGAAPHVRLFRGDTGALMGGFFAYAQNFLGGVRVAIGDITGDGKGELLTGAGAGGAPHVMVRDASNFSILRSFFAGSPLDRSGVSLTAADLDGDGKAEIIAAAGRGPNSGRINIYRGTNNSLLRTTKIKDAAFGLFVGTQDVNADGTPEIFYSNGVGGSSRVGTLNSLNLKDIDAFYSNDPRFMGGTSIS